MAKLTDKQMAFVVEIAKGGCTNKQAALTAGYSPANAESQASQMLKKPHVKAELERIRGNAVAQAQGTKAKALDRIWDLAESAADEDNRREAYQGYELWLKASGHLVEKREINTNQTIDVEWRAPVGGDE